MRTDRPSPGRVLLAGLVATLLLVRSGAAIAAPERIRLSFTGDTASTMTITWHTAADTATEVQYGTQPGAYTATATGTAQQGSGALGWIHEVTLTGLAPETRYYYVVGNATDGWSSEHSFQTGPVQDDRCGQFTFAFVGDNRPDPTFGGGQNWVQIVGQVAAHGPGLILNGGDLVIDGDQIDQWLDFLADTEPVAAEIPFLPCLGNHDDGPGEGDGAIYNQVFALPRSGGTWGSGTEDYYYVTYGNAIFVSLSTESFKGGAYPFENQANWLDEVLTAHPKKWKFVFYHKPSYTHEALFSISHAPNEEAQNAALVPVIDAHHVDVVFTSHNHWYERFEPSACASAGNPGSDAACSVGAGNYNAGTVYYVSGGAGAFTIPEFLCGSESGRAACSGDHHYILVTIQDNVATLETWAAYPQTNQVIDAITITKPADTCDVPPLPDGGVPDAGANADGSVPGADAAQLPDGQATGPDASASDAGGSADAASLPDAGPAGSDPDSGCACQSGGARPPVAPTGLVLLLALGLLARWRRRRAPPRA